MKRHLLFSLVLTGVCSAVSATPNMVYILADAMGIGDIAALNAEAKVKTPHLDSLVAEGMNFSDAHTAPAVCTPTR